LAFGEEKLHLQFLEGVFEQVVLVVLEDLADEGDGLDEYVGVRGRGGGGGEFEVVADDPALEDEYVDLGLDALDGGLLAGEDFPDLVVLLVVVVDVE
jgi:hypothetical protein